MLQAARAILRAFVVLLALAGVAAGAAAQDGGAPYISSVKERYRLFVFGDKMATGLLAGLWRVLGNSGRVLAKGRFRAGSGLARLRYHDWQRNIAQVLESRPVDIAVMMLGVNDVRDMTVKGKRIAFGSAAWRELYASRIDAIIQTFRDRNVALYWVGLPPMRDPALDSAVQQINELIAQRARTHGVRFIPIRAHFAGADGGFVENGKDINGQITRLRARNGIHFIKAGNTVLARIVWNVIRKDIEAARQAPAGGALAALTPSRQPFMGRAAPDGAPEYLPASLLPRQDAVFLASSAAMSASSSTLQTLRRIAAPNSAAASLFEQGTMPPAPKGRVDDFTLSGETRSAP